MKKIWRKKVERKKKHFTIIVSSHVFYVLYYYLKVESRRRKNGKLQHQQKFVLVVKILTFESINNTETKYCIWFLNCGVF